MKYNASHFSISLPQGENQDNVPELFRHFADSLEKEKNIEVLDIVFNNETDGKGKDWPSVTVYYVSKENAD